MPRRTKGEGSIVRRKEGYWQAALQVDGVRRTVYGKTRGEAVAKLDELKRQAARAGTMPDPGRRTLNDLLDAWLQTKAPTLKPRTLSDYRATCDRYIRPTLGKLPLAKVTPDRVQRLCARYQAKGQHRTALKVYRRLSQALDLAVRWSWIAANPCDRVDTPRYRPERKALWTPEELRLFLTGTEGHWLHPLWTVAVCSGCRLGELLALTWADVDLKAGTLTITKSAQRVDGERVVTTPKTRAGTRTISLPRDAVDALRRQATWRLQQGKGGELVFTSRAGRPLAHSAVEWSMARECTRLGLPHLTPHGLRHLSASLLLSQGLPIPDVSRRLGHANPAITMSVYAHALGASDTAAADALGAVLSG